MSLFTSTGFNISSLCPKIPYCIQKNIRPVLFSPLSPSFSVRKFKTGKIQCLNFFLSDCNCNPKIVHPNMTFFWTLRIFEYLKNIKHYNMKLSIPKSLISSVCISKQITLVFVYKEFSRVCASAGSIFRFKSTCMYMYLNSDVTTVEALSSSMTTNHVCACREASLLYWSLSYDYFLLLKPSKFFIPFKI